MKSAIIGVIALIVLVGGGYLLTHKSSNKPAPTSSSQTQTSNTPASTPSQTNPNTITFDGTQFSPASLTVKAGSTVTIKNTSSQDLQMDSNPHPVHTDDPDLNVGLVAAGQSQTFTVHQTGTFGYHDHFQPGIQGRITIE